MDDDRRITTIERRFAALSEAVSIELDRMRERISKLEDSSSSPHSSTGAPSSLPSSPNLRAIWESLRVPGLEFVETWRIAQRAALSPQEWRAQTARLLDRGVIAVSGEVSAILTAEQRSFGIEAVPGRFFYLVRWA